MPKDHKELTLKARAVSRGIGIGKIICLHGNKRQFYRVNLKKSEIPNEIRRFRSALLTAKTQIKKISEQQFENFIEHKINIFETHLLILEDDSLILKIEQTIESEKINAEWAVKFVCDEYISLYKSAVDQYFRERYIDVEDVADRIQTALGGEQSTLNLEKNSIIVAEVVNPSTIIELAKFMPRAIITERGGWTSHSFILARELNLPAVTGLKKILRRVQNGDEVIVDGFNGKIVLFPEKETIIKFENEAERIQSDGFETTEDHNDKSITLDGREIKICANVDQAEGYTKAVKFGARGIGLYRSEFLFNRSKRFPTEAEQIAAYQKTAQAVGDDGIRIRTFDLNVDQLDESNSTIEQNPALGLRGIRLSFARKKQFQLQLRALLRASADYKIDVVLPMISDISEILQAKIYLQKEKQNLIKEGIRFGEPRIGTMIEVPATIFMIEEIAREVDFLSLGTNDLVQYLLAVDRDNEAVADWFRTLHPAVLRSVKKVIEASESNKIPLVICGEMAGSPVYAAILIGLGATELSMNPNSILRIKKLISGIAFEEAREVAKQLLMCKTSNDSEQLVTKFFTKKWSHLFSSEILPHSK